MTRVSITGVGLITPLGNSAWATWRALLDGRTLTDRCGKLLAETDAVPLVLATGGVALARQSPIDPALMLAEHAARQAVTESGDEPFGLPVLLAMSKGAVADFRAVPAGPVDRVGRHLAERLNLEPAGAVVAACASSLIGLHLARQRIERGELRRVLLVTCEAALQPIFIHSYRRLGVLPPLNPDGYRCLPLDEGRSGFVLTEVAAAVMLEADAGERALVDVADTAIAAEANDVIRTPDRREALRRIADRLLAPGVDLLHPHATGTVDNDASEMRTYAGAIAAAGVDPPDIYACKGALGHGLGSAGLTGVVLAALAARSQRRPPMPWLAAPIDTGIAIHANATPRRIDRQVLFSAGFGAHVAGAALETT